MSLNTADGEDKIYQKGPSVKTRILKHIERNYGVKDQDFSNIVNDSMKQGFSTIYTCTNDGNDNPIDSSIKDVFIVYSQSIKFFLEGFFSTIGIHTTRDEKLSTRQLICHVVALDDSSRPFPLLTGYLSDQKEETYVALLRALFYSLYCRKFMFGHLADLWNESFEKYLFNEVQYMPIKILLVEPIQELSKALDHFPFFHSDTSLNLNTVLKMHLQGNLTEEEESNELKFMKLERDTKVSLKKESKYILVKFCSWTTTLGHIQTFSPYFDFEVNVSMEYNLSVARKVKNASSVPKNKSNPINDVYTDLEKFGIVLDDIKSSNSDNLNLAAMYHIRNRRNPNNVEGNVENRFAKEIQKRQEYTSLKNQSKATIKKELDDSSIFLSKEIDGEPFDLNGVLRVDNNPLWSEQNWIFTTEFAELFQYDEKIKQIFLKVFGSSPKISFGLLFSKISSMMNTSSLEEGLDLLLSIVWCLTRLKDGDKIFQLLQQDVLHVKNRYRFNYFLGNLLKLSVINCNNGGEIENKIPLSYCRSRFFIHTYHNGAFNALFAKNMASDLQSNKATQGLSVMVSHINENAYKIIVRTLKERLTYKQVIPTIPFVEEDKLFYYLQNSTTSKSSALLGIAFDNLRRRVISLRESLFKVCLPFGSIEKLAKSPELIESLNHALIINAEKSCNKICYLAFGIPCEHVLLMQYLSVDIVKDEDDNYKFRLKSKRSIRPDKHFLDNQFEKLFDEKNKHLTKFTTDDSANNGSTNVLSINAFLDTIHPETKEHIRSIAVEKKLASLPYTESVQDSDRLNLEAFIARIDYALSQNDNAAAKKSNKRLYSQMKSTEKQEINSTQSNATDKESGETFVNKDSEPNGFGKQTKHVANKLEEGTTNREKVESPSNSTSNNDIDPNSSTDSTSNITIYGNIHGTVNSDTVNNGIVNNHHEHDYIITNSSPSSSCNK